MTRGMAAGPDILLKALEATALAVMITDPDGRIIKINPAFSRITGWDARSAIGQTPRILRSGRQSGDFYADMWRRLIEEGHWRGVIWNRRRDGEIYPELLTIDALRDDKGRTTHFVGVFSDVTVEQQREEQLSRLAYLDEVTRLPNRALFYDRARNALALARRRGVALALLVLDLDGFKHVNDSYGHAAGDALLRAAGERIQHDLRESDTTGRLGGDEFAVLLPEVTGEAGAAVVARRIVSALREPFEISGNIAHIGASLGIALFPTDSTNVEGLMEAADAAMYNVKRSGKSDYAFAPGFQHVLPKSA